MPGAFFVWSDQPLLAVEFADGLSVLMLPHTGDGQAVNTTTSQRQDEAPRHSEQPVEDGTLLLQSSCRSPTARVCSWLSRRRRPAPSR